MRKPEYIYTEYIEARWEHGSWVEGHWNGYWKEGFWEGGISPDWAWRNADTVVYIMMCQLDPFSLSEMMPYGYVENRLIL